MLWTRTDSSATSPLGCVWAINQIALLFECMDCQGQKVVFCHSEFLHNVWVSWMMSHYIASIELIPVPHGKAKE